MLACRNITKRYDNGVYAVRNANLCLHEGEAVFLAGSSGSGKSTLARLLLCLEKPDSGEVLLDNAPYQGGRKALVEFRKKVQIIFQNSAALDPRRTVFKTLAEPLDNFGKHDNKKERIERLLHDTGLALETAQKYPHEISGGERQRVGIARALAAGPSYLICDEPVSSLDAAVRDQILTLLDSLRINKNLALLFITHDLELARRFCSRGFIMQDGVLSSENNALSCFDIRTQPDIPKMSSAVPLLKVSGLTIALPEKSGAQRIIVNSINLQLERGAALGIAGNSGCGKTVFCQALAGMLEPPLFMQQGSIFLSKDGALPLRDITALDQKTWRTLRGKTISMIFQNPLQSLNHAHTVQTQFIEAIRAHTKTAKKECIELAGHLLAKVMLDNPKQILRMYPYELSGGMCQRVMTAMALVHRPALLIADEPTTALDAANELAVLKLFNRIREEYGTALLIVSHDKKALNAVTDDIIYIPSQ